MNLKQIIRNWWQGWSDTDLTSILEKVKNAQPGAIIPMTDAERRAHIAEIQRILDD